MYSEDRFVRLLCCDTQKRELNKRAQLSMTHHLSHNWVRHCSLFFLFFFSWAPYGHKDIVFWRVTVVLHISRDVEFLGRCWWLLTEEMFHLGGIYQQDPSLSHPSVRVDSVSPMGLSQLPQLSWDILKTSAWPLHEVSQDQKWHLFLILSWHSFLCLSMVYFNSL